MKTNDEPHKNWLSCPANYENVHRRSTIHYADVLEWSEEATKPSIKKQKQKKKTHKSLIWAEPNPTPQDERSGRAPNIICSELHMEQMKTNEWLFCLQYMAPCAQPKPGKKTFVCLGLVAQKQDGENNRQVSVTESRKVIAGFLHSRDRRKMVKTQVVIME